MAPPRSARLHAFADGLEALAIGQLRDPVGQVHVGDLLGRLGPAAALGDGRPVDDLGRGERPAQAVDLEGPEVGRRAQPAGRGADVLENAADQGVGILVFFPRPDLLAGRDELLGPGRLEGRTDPDGVLLEAEDDAEDALAQPPADLGEIEEIGAAADEDGVEAAGGEQAPGLLLARRVVLGRERLDPRHEVLELLREGGPGRPCGRSGPGPGQAGEPQARPAISSRS